MTTLRENIRRLAEEQRNAWEVEGKPLADLAQEREFTAEEAQKFERLEEAYNSYDQRINAMVAQQTIEDRLIALSSESRADGVDAPADVATQLRSVLRGESGAADIVPTREEVRALSVGTPTAGGNTVGKSYLAQLIEPLRQFSGIVAAGAFQLVTEKGDEVVIPRLSSAGAAAAHSEGTQLTGTDPAFNQVSFKAFKYGDYRGVSRELVDDSLFDIEALTSRLIGENIAVLLGQKLAVGVGTTEPTGIAAAATTGVTGATGVAGVPSFDNLIDLQESVIAPYQPNASWVLSNSAMSAIRKLKDSQNRYLWEPNGQTGAPGTLLGAPVFRDPFIAATGLGAKSVFYGDFSRYWLRLVGSVRVERSDHALFGSDQVAFRGVLRADGNLVDTGAVKAFVGGAS